MAYGSKTRKYIYNNTGTIASGEPIKVELSEAFIHFCYHPERKEYIKINPPAGQEASAKYIVTVSNCHWIRERNITVIALLTYATQRAQVAGNNLKIAIKEAPTEEVLHVKVAEQGCYVDLVELSSKKSQKLYGLGEPTSQC